MSRKVDRMCQRIIIALAILGLGFTAVALVSALSKAPGLFPREHVTPYCPNLRHTHWEPCGPEWETEI